MANSLKLYEVHSLSTLPKSRQRTTVLHADAVRKPVLYRERESPHLCTDVNRWGEQESPADAVKPARRKSMQKLFQFDVFRFISPNSISPNFKV